MSNYNKMSSDVVRNQSVPLLNDIFDRFVFLYDCILSQNDALHYQKETIRCLGSLTREMKKHMLGEHCSQKYMNEQLQKLSWLTKQYSVRDDVDIYEQSKSER